MRGEGRHEQAWRQLVADNPLPAICGRVCYHRCETACNRASLDSAVSIHGVERFLGDRAFDRGWSFDRPAAPSGKRVLIVGGGPSGLSAAYHLARRGHEVEIRDGGEQMGGMMRYGIPAYRLPRDVLDCEIARIADLGVRMTCEHRVDNLDGERRDGGFDAVFVAVGAHLSKRVDIPARDAGRIVDAISLLRSVASGERPALGRHVAVYGGGNTAMDAARVARPLGADDALIVYRRTRGQMPAHAEEAAEAEREGVKINWLRTVTAFDGPELTVEQMELDENGIPRPTGRLETLTAVTVILAAGQETDAAFLRLVPGVDVSKDGTVSGRNVNVLVLDTEVYSNTGGQSSKATPLRAIAKFAASGKTMPKKDLALQAIACGYVYVARVAMGADSQQTLRAFREAEAYDGPSLIIAYSHCIAHGIEMRDGLSQQHKAAASGYWPLLRYDPVLRTTGQNPFLLDSPRPRTPLADYTRQELRYRALANTDPAEAERLAGLAQQAVDQRWATYEEMASRAPAWFPADARRETG